MVGYVYIFTNAAMDGFLKIGKTTRTPAERARELSRPTGVASPYSVAWYAEVIDCDAAESLIHARLDKYRPKQDREFFCLPTDEAIRELLAIVTTVGRPIRAPAVPPVKSPADMPTDIAAFPTATNPAFDSAVMTLGSEEPAPVQTEVAYFAVETHSASQMAPRLAAVKVRHLSAIREIVLQVCPDCLWRMRGDGKIIFTPAKHKNRAKFRNLITVHLQENPIHFRIDDTLNKQRGGNSEQLDENRLAEMPGRLSALLAIRNGMAC